MVAVIRSPTLCSCSVPGKNWLRSIVTFVPTLFVFWKIFLSWVIFCVRLWRAHFSFLTVSQSQQSWATESHLVVNAKKTGFLQLLSRVRSLFIRTCSGSAAASFWNPGEVIKGAGASALGPELFEFQFCWSPGKCYALRIEFVPFFSKVFLCHMTFVGGGGAVFHIGLEWGARRGRRNGLKRKEYINLPFFPPSLPLPPFLFPSFSWERIHSRLTLIKLNSPGFCLSFPRAGITGERPSY